MKTKLFTCAGGVALALVIGAPADARAELLYGLSRNTLFSFDSSNPGTIGGVYSISGLQGDRLIGIDVRPATGSLFGLGASLRLYDINPNDGSANLVSGTGIGSFGTSYGFDFNPVADAVRVVNNSGQNYRISPNGSLIATDGTLAYAVNDPNFGRDPAIGGVAYANNFGGAGTTTLYAIDYATDTLTLIPSPNNGVLRTIGLLGVNTTEKVSFDISGVSGTGYAALTKPSEGGSGIYKINLDDGSASFVGNVAFGAPLDGLTVAAVPEPSVWALLSLGAGALYLRRHLRAGKKP